MIFADGLEHPEGPVLLDDGSWLVVETLPRGCITQLDHDGKSRRTVAHTGQPNGLAVEASGAIWVAEVKSPSLLRVTAGGAVEVFVSECDGEALLWPNDLCFGPDGALYLTDSGVPFSLLAPDGVVRAEELAARRALIADRVDGRVYRVDTRRRHVSCLDSGLRFPNGIAFGPEGDLYVNETLSGDVLRYRLGDGGDVSERSLFANVLASEASDGWVGPDGMAFDCEGRLYVAVLSQGDVTVLDRDGSVARRVKTQGTLPTNVAFGPPGQGRLFVTEIALGQIEILDVGVDGLALHR